MQKIKPAQNFIVIALRFGLATLLAAFAITGLRGDPKLVSEMTMVQQQYDLRTRQRPVYSHAKLDSVIKSLSTIWFDSLPKSYLLYSGAEPMRYKLAYTRYYLLHGEDIFKFIVGSFRIADLIPKDTFFQQNLDSLPKGITQYWLMDKTELHAFMDLVLNMRQKGYNDSALSINHGYRHPAYNKKVGGVSASYHMMGIAIDLKIGDIDRNGVADSSDKQKVLEILEKEIIGDRGGLGLYPKTDVLHFDVRGYRARWNSH